MLDAPRKGLAAGDVPYAKIHRNTERMRSVE
jgi:hypothetical protein